MKAIRAVMAAGAVALALIGATVAHADPGSDNRDYLQALAKDGITVTDPQYMIGLGRSLCPAIERWDDPYQIAATQVPRSIPPNQAYRIVMDAAETLCWSGRPATAPLPSASAPAPSAPPYYPPPGYTGGNW